MKKSLIVVVWLLVAGFAQAKGHAGEVRNVIYMIGDGMGLAQVSMLQIENEFAPTAFDRAQGVALITTRSANNRVTDSAAAGTALASGYKTNNAMLGQLPDGTPVSSMMTLAQEKGMATGIVVTCYLQHATPAAFYAHVADRGDSESITEDLLQSGVDVLLGGGRKWLIKKGADSLDYFDAFRSRGYRVVESLSDAEQIHGGRLLGVMAAEHLPRVASRGDYLPQATKKALEILTANTESRQMGFMLMVEGSLIDYGGHENNRDQVLAEIRDFDRAVTEAMDFADRTPGTLVVVCADHETGGFTIPSRNADFTRSESGVGYAFSTKGHTGTMVPVYLYGAGADKIVGVMDNTDLARRIMALSEIE